MSTRKSVAGVFGVVLLFTFVVRGGVLLLTPDALTRDTDDYRRLAENLVEHGTFGRGDTPTAFRPPLYPLLLTGCVALGDGSRVAISLLHVLLGVATVAMVFLLGRWWDLGTIGATIAALLTACDPILLAQSTQIMTETPATFLVTAGLVMITWTLATSGIGCPENANASDIMKTDPLATTQPWNGFFICIATGAVLSLGAICRPTLLLWALAVGLALLVKTKNSRELTAPGKCLTQFHLPLMFALGMVLVLCPWMIRNQIEFGRPVAATTHGGYTLLLANNPEFYEWLRTGDWGDVWRADHFNAEWDRRKPSDEIEANRLAYHEAWQNICREPGMFCYACFVRLGRFWSPLPHQVSADETTMRRFSRYAVAAWYVLEFLLTGIGAWCIFQCRRTPHGFLQPWLYALLLVVSLTAIHSLFWTDMRMRAVVMPVVALATAAACTWRRKRPNKHPSLGLVV